MQVKFTIPGRIGGKGRPRFARVGNFVRTFTPAKTVNMEAMIRTIAAEAMGGRELFTGPVSLIVLMTLQPAASWSAKKRAAARFVVGKPDPDNSLKLFDAINGIVWRDDSQICDVLFRRRYSIFEAESVRVWIADAEDDLVMPEVPQFARAPIDDPLPLFRRIRKRRAAA